MPELLASLAAYGGPAVFWSALALAVWRLDRRLYRIELHLFNGKGQQ